MTRAVTGLHHVTAIAGNPQRNIDFYAGALGLRLVKKTVNFDDPNSYHFYFGNELGAPGSLITFFSWPGTRRGVAGSGQVSLTSFSVPEGSLGYWQDRFRSLGLDSESTARRSDDEERLRVRDFDGMEIELVAHADAAALPAWSAGPVPEGKAIRSLFGVTLSEGELERTARFLEESLHFHHLDDTDGGIRYATGQGPGRVLELRAIPGAPARIAAGSVHHIAFRVPDDPTELACQRELYEKGVAVSPVMDRSYFHSIYFREPGGVLFEIATDPPGFTIDESPEELGSGLKLPPQYESHRTAIEARLPVVTVPLSTVETRS